MKTKFLPVLLIAIVLASGCVEQAAAPKENVTHRFDKGFKIIDFKRFSSGIESCGGMAIEIKSGLENPINVSSLRLYADDAEIDFVIASEGAMGITTELECVLYPNKTLTLWNWNLGCIEKKLTEPREQARTGIVMPAGTVVKARGEFPNKLRVEVENYYSEVDNIRPLSRGHDVSVSVVPRTISCN